MDYTECLLPCYLSQKDNPKTPQMIYEMLGYSLHQNFKAYIEYNNETYHLTFLSPQHVIREGNCFHFEDLNQKLFPKATYLNYLLKTGPFVMKIHYHREQGHFLASLLERDMETSISHIRHCIPVSSIKEAFEELESSLRLEMQSQEKVYTLFRRETL